jgi:hypothetical protein
VNARPYGSVHRARHVAQLPIRVPADGLGDLRPSSPEVWPQASSSCREDQ